MLDHPAWRGHDPNRPFAAPTQHAQAKRLNHFRIFHLKVLAGVLRYQVNPSNFGATASAAPLA